MEFANPEKALSVVVTSPSFSQHATLKKDLAEISSLVHLNSEGLRLNEENLAEYINHSRCECLVLGTEPLTAKVIADLKHVKFVAKYGVGLDNVDQKALSARNIGFAFTSGVNSRSVSELALAFMLGHCRNVFNSVKRLTTGSWRKEGGVQLTGKKVGIIGLGHVGSDLAALLAPFSGEIFYNDIVDKTKIAKNLGLKYLELNQLIAESDIVSLHVPHTDKTHHLINAYNLQLFKNDALLVNTARGDVVDFLAVCDAVQNSKLGGYASDVFPKEPLDLRDILKSENFYFTPHIGGSADEAILAMGRASLHHLREYAQRL